MSKSFDDKIRERLQHYETPPPADSRKIILDKVDALSDSGWVYLYQGAAAFLLLLSLFQIGHFPAPVGMTHQPHIREIVSNPDPVLDLTENLPFEKRMELPPPTQIQELEYQVKVPEENTFGPVQLKQHEGSFLGAFSEWQIEPLEDQPEMAGRARNLTGGRYIRKTVKGVVPERKRWISPYYSLGAFFIYNRLRPDLTDDIYVGEYDAPFGLSGSRIGFNAEFGAHKRWTSWLASRLGVSVNNYSQQYSFSVRGNRPDSVSVGLQNGFLEPHFDSQEVQISERVTLIGLKGQAFWYVFPNETDVLFTSLEYQRLIGQGPQFTYEGNQYLLMKPSQYLLEIGLRKTIFQLQTGQVYAMPSIRYVMNRFVDGEILSVRPFSVGITISYGIK